ncbi:hypothetical protein [Deinococcus xianganensis]|uniref:Uncharacterized protein n=1 Tax=Deinococcus xianganensis TaxID=1507289 RepID=A0A6I4YPD0_9DEIO|nr:hypothetical protein [Deinococcus xianganensis]MXV21971.1 hypothetical protein [Deinococcus xianganensis]
MDNLWFSKPARDGKSRYQKSLCCRNAKGVVEYDNINKLGFADLGDIYKDNPEKLKISEKEAVEIAKFIKKFRELRNSTAHSNKINDNEFEELKKEIMYIRNMIKKGSSSIKLELTDDLVRKGFVPGPDDLRAYAQNETATTHRQAIGRRNKASLEESNQLASNIIDYYKQHNLSTQSTIYAMYRSKEEKERILAFASKKEWVEIFESNKDPSVLSYYIDPSDQQLPEVPHIMHTPHRVSMGRFDLMDLGPYSLRNIRVTGKDIELYFSEMSFYEWNDRYGDLEDEFISSVPDLLDRKKGLRDINFDLRNRYLPDLGTVFNFNNRLAAGGVVVLTIIPTDIDANNALILVEERSGDVSDGRELLTTIPRGFHDRFASSRDDYHLETTVLREVAEEVFNRSGLRNGEIDTQVYLEASPPIADLMGSQKYILMPTGFGIDLLKGNYTVTYLLLVTDKSWWRKYRHSQSLNYEFKQNGESRRLMLSETKQLERILQRPDWTSEGFFAFVEGLRALPRVLKTANLMNLKTPAEAAERVLPKLEWVPFSDD